MSSRWSRLKSGTGGAALLLVGGAGLGQIVMLGMTPVLARIYHPEAFGYFSLVAAVSGVVAPVACLRLESALLLPDSKSSATSLLGAGGVSALLVCVLTGGGLQLTFAAGLLRELSDLPWFSAWASLVALLTALFGLASQFALRAKKFGAVARRGVYQSVVTVFSQVGLHWFLPGAGGLLAGNALGRTAGIMPMVLASRGELRAFGLADVRREVRHYWRFPLLFAPATLANGLGLAIPVLFIGEAFGVSDAGQWGMADRMLGAPALLIGMAASQIVESRLAELLRSGGQRLAPFFMRVSAVLIVCGVMLSFGVFLLASAIIPLVLGPGWESTVDLLKILVMATSVRLVGGAMTKALVVLQRAKANLMMDVVRLLLLVGGLMYIRAASLSLNQAALIVALVMMLVYVVGWWISYLAVRSHDANL